MENTLKRILQLAQGHALNMTFMLVGEQVTMSCTPSPIVGDKTAQPLAPFRGTFHIDAIDDELAADFEQVFEGELCTSVQRVGAMKKALLNQEQEKDKKKAATTPAATPSKAATPVTPPKITVAPAPVIAPPDDEEEEVPADTPAAEVQGPPMTFDF